MCCLSSLEPCKKNLNYCDEKMDDKEIRKGKKKSRECRLTPWVSVLSSWQATTSTSPIQTIPPRHLNSRS